MPKATNIDNYLDDPEYEGTIWALVFDGIRTDPHWNDGEYTYTPSNILYRSLNMPLYRARGHAGTPTSLGHLTMIRPVLWA